MNVNGQAGEHFRAADAAQAIHDAPEPSGRAFDDVLAEIVADTYDGKPLIDVRETGVAILDATAGGLVAGEYLGIHAGPGVGKSLLADKLVFGVLENNRLATGLIFALETVTRVRIARLLCGATVQIRPDDEGKPKIARFVPLGQMLRGTLDTDARKRARETAEKLQALIGDRLTFVDDVADAYDISARIRADAPTVTLIDHLGQVTAGISGSSTEQMDYAIRTISDAIRETKTAGIIVNEITLQGMRDDQDGIGAGRGSAKFPSLAGQMLTLKRIDGDEIALRLVKNRHGPAMIRQAAVLFGGCGYIHFAGEPERDEPEKKPKGDKQAKKAAANEND